MKRKAAGGLTVLLICMILLALAFGGRGGVSRQAALRQNGAPGKDAAAIPIAPGEPSTGMTCTTEEETETSAAAAEEKPDAVPTDETPTAANETAPAQAETKTDDAPASPAKTETPEATVDAAAPAETAPAGSAPTAPQTTRANAPAAPGNGKETVLVPNFYYHGALDATGGRLASV